MPIWLNASVSPLVTARADVSPVTCACRMPALYSSGTQPMPYRRLPGQNEPVGPMVRRSRAPDSAIFGASALQAPDSRFSLALTTILSASRPSPNDRADRGRSWLAGRLSNSHGTDLGPTRKRLT